MSNQLKKKIIIPTANSKYSLLVSFFIEIGFSVEDNFNQNIKEEYLFILDNYLPEIKSIPRLITDESLIVENNNEIAFLSLDKIETDEVKFLFKKYYSEPESFSVQNLFPSTKNEVIQIKVQDYLNVGFFIDSIVILAYENQFDINLVRNYLNIIFPKCLNMVEETNGPLLIEVTYSASNLAFVLQVEFNVSDIKINFNDLIKNYKDTNFLDVTYNKKRQKLKISTLWFKEQSLKSFHSYFVNEIQLIRKNENNLLITNILDKDDSNIKYEPKVKKQVDEVVISKNPDLPETIYKIIGQKLNDEKFIKRIRAGLPEEVETWRVKHLDVAEKIKQKIENLEVKINLENIEEKLSEIISTEFDIAGPQEIVNEIVSLVKSEKNISSSNNPEVIKVPEKNYRDDNKIFKMKRILEQLRNELIKYKIKNDELIELNSRKVATESNIEISQLKKELYFLEIDMKTKDKLKQKMTIDFERKFAIKDEKIKNLEELNLQLKDEIKKIVINNNVELNENLENENKSLKSKIDLMNKKISIISENLKKQDLDIVSKKDKEINQLKNNILSLSEINKKLKIEKTILEKSKSEEKSDKDQINKLIDNSGPSTKYINELNEKSHQILLLENDKKILEEKYKNMSTEFKKHEQKMKFAMAQFEDLQRRSATKPNQTIKNNELTNKQLEKVSAKNSELSSELIDKKKDLLKLKQDNTLLTIKVTELERKIVNLEKKAA